MSKQNSIIARRYSKALWGSIKNGNADVFLSNLTDLKKILEEDQGLKVLAESPVFTSEEKTKVFSEIFEKLGFSDSIKDFLNLLLAKDRFVLLPEIEEEFHQLFLQANKTKEARVESAFLMTDAQKASVKNVLEAALDTTVNIEAEVNEALIAGIRVHVDGRTIDASLSSNLNVLKEELLVAEA